MSGTVLVEYLAGVVPAALLIVAGVRHVRHPTALADDLRRQRLVPGRAVGVVAVALPVVEVLLGAVGIAWLHGGVTTVGAAAVAGTVILYALFAASTTALLRRGDGRRVPCGCSPTGADVTGVVPLRAAALALLALAALLTAPSASALSAFELSVAGLAAATFTTLLWTVPSALTRGQPIAKERVDVVHG